MKAADIRRSFVDYFTARDHSPVSSSSLAPQGDPTLLFTNAGMVQFKRVFQGLEKRDYRRAVTVQKCVRAGGKHNDLEEVGRTARHHTFFEMLGNFSFGDYFKERAIEYAWEWVTSETFLGIHPDRIYISVHHTDSEARSLWRRITGVDDSRIYRLGDEDNFWQMGDTGPCGPCSEIFVDLRSADDGLAKGLTTDEFVECNEAGQLLEIWNLVFMQFDQATDGSRSPLPAPSVDTGAGLERIAAVMQRVPSNFDTDLFMEIIAGVEELVELSYDRGERGVGFRVLADHARAVSFLLADGVFPSNDGRGYVLRRILRRAVRHAYLLGRRDPTLTHLAEIVIRQMANVYPELREKASHIKRVTQAEEERFLETIDGGLSRLDDLMKGASGIISGDDVFKLHDTFGFPLDLTQLIASERGWSVDTSGFDAALEAQRTRSRQGTKAGLPVARQGLSPGTGGEPSRGTRQPRGRFTRLKPRVRQKFVGYDTTRTETDVIAFRQSEDQLELILQDNPFYAESGGQVGDTGTVSGPAWSMEVKDVQKEDGKQVIAGSFADSFDLGELAVDAVVDEPRRRDIERNHSATHLVHAALRAVLGEHVRQAGSAVAPDRLRFDFSHHSPVTHQELEAIEQEVNRGIWENVEIETSQMSYDKAIVAGAMALFGEKYGDMVRVVNIPGVSMELCGGTHVRSTGQIGLFHFTGESGVQAGVRRIEAVTGPGAYELVKTLDERVANVAAALRTSPEHAARKIEALLEEKRRLEKQIGELLKSGPAGQSSTGEQYRVGDITVAVDESPVSDRGQVGLIMDAFRRSHSKAIQVLITTGERASVHVAVTDDLISRGIRAGDIVRRVVALTGGKGGGKPHFASGGIVDRERVRDMRAQIPDVVASAVDGGEN